MVCHKPQTQGTPRSAGLFLGGDDQGELRQLPGPPVQRVSEYVADAHVGSLTDNARADPAILQVSHRAACVRSSCPAGAVDFPSPRGITVMAYEGTARSHLAKVRACLPLQRL